MLGDISTLPASRLGFYWNERWNSSNAFISRIFQKLIFFFFFFNRKVEHFLAINHHHAFTEASYWARDIIFLITEHEQLGVEAWLEAYHSTSSASSIINFGELDARAGAIQVIQFFFFFLNSIYDILKIHFKMIGRSKLGDSF